MSHLVPSSLALLTLLVLAAGCAGQKAAAPDAAAAPASAARAQPAEAAPAVATVSIPVSGMTCGGCARRVTGALQAVAGVRSAEVLLAERRAVVTFDSARVEPAALVAAIRDAGYEPGTPVAP